MNNFTYQDVGTLILYIIIGAGALHVAVKIDKAYPELRCFIEYIIRQIREIGYLIGF